MKKNDHELQNSGSRLLTTKEAADRLGVKEAYIKRMCREGKLNGIKVGKFWRVTKTAIAEFIANLHRGQQRQRRIQQRCQGPYPVSRHSSQPGNHAQQH